MLASGNYAKLCYMMLARLQSVNYAFYAKASVAQPNQRGNLNLGRGNLTPWGDFIVAVQNPYFLDYL